MTARHPLLADGRRLARYLLLGAGGAAAGYAAYRLYRSDAAAEGRAQLARLRAALGAYADAFGTGADTLQLLAADLRAFLLSDRHDVPPSLRQLARLMQSQEAADTASATVAALVRGVTAASGGGAAPDGAAAPKSGQAPQGPGALDRTLEALLSERGQSLVTVAVGLGARNLMAAYCEAQHRLASDGPATAAGQPQSDLPARLLDFLASPRGQRLAVLSVTAFVSSGMRAYLDQTLDINFYEDLFAAMAKPQHLEAVKQCVGVFARDVVGAYLAGPSGGQEAGPTQLRLSSSIQELLNGGAAHGRQPPCRPEEEGLPADSGSPCGSSASGEWRQSAVRAAAAASDIDSDVLLRPDGVPAKGGEDAGTQGGGWAVGTPPAAGEAARGGGGTQLPVPPALRRLQQEAREGGLQREGSGNLEWISAVGKEWLNVAQHPQGRTVMVELAGAAAKEAARGVSSALAERVRVEWLVVAACAALLLAWLLQRTVGLLFG